MRESDRQKEQIAGLYHRVAGVYGQVGPNIFAYAGQHLVERMGLENRLSNHAASWRSA